MRGKPESNTIQDKGIVREYAHALAKGNVLLASKIDSANIDLKGELATVKSLYNGIADPDVYKRFAAYL